MVSRRNVERIHRKYMQNNITKYLVVFINLKFKMKSKALLYNMKWVYIRPILENTHEVLDNCDIICYSNN